MEEFAINKETFVMCSDPSPDLTAEMVSEAMEKIETEQELASLFAVVENKAWWIEDEEYDYNEETNEHKQAKERTDVWFALADKLKNRIFDILRTEGFDIPETRQIDVLESFMKRNGFIDGQGWWIKP